MFSSTQTYRLSPEAIIESVSAVSAFALFHHPVVGQTPLRWSYMLHQRIDGRKLRRGLRGASGQHDSGHQRGQQARA